MNKARYIEAHYTQVLQYDLEDLDIDIDWAEVEDYSVKWTTLYIELKNGEVIEIDNYQECDTDWKWATKVQAYDEDFNEVKLTEEELCKEIK